FGGCQQLSFSRTKGGSFDIPARIVFAVVHSTLSKVTKPVGQFSKDRPTWAVFFLLWDLGSTSSRCSIITLKLQSLQKPRDNIWSMPEFEERGHTFRLENWVVDRR